MCGFLCLTLYYKINATVKDRNEKVNVVKNFGSTALPVKHKSRQTKTCCVSNIDGNSHDIIDNFKRIIDCGSISITDNYQTNSILKLKSQEFFLNIKNSLRIY